MTDILWLLERARPARGILILSIIARILGHFCLAAIIAVPLWVLGHAAGPVLTPSEAGSSSAGGALPLVVTTTLLVVLSVAAGALRYLEQFTGHLAAFRLLGELRVWIMQHILPQAPAVVDVRGSARLWDIAVRDVDRIEVFFAHTIAPAASAVVVPTVAVVVACSMGGLPAGATLAVVLGLGWVIPLMRGQADRSSARAIGQARSDLTQHVADSLRMRDVILAAGTWQERLEAMRQHDEQLGEAVMVRARRAGIRDGATTWRIWSGMVAVLAVGLVTEPENIAGVLVATAMVPGTATGLETLERLALSLPEGLDATRRIRELAESKPLVSEPVEPVSVPAASSDTLAVHAHEVAFTYPGRPLPVLDGVSLQLAPGDTLGVMGPTGSGKSTIARLLQRHRDPARGEVQIHGVSTVRLGSDQVQRIVAVADQDPFLMNATVRDNLRLAAPEATDDTLRLALHAACSTVPLDRVIGQRGQQLSGGERQRLALARTLVRALHAPGGPERSVLVLDEATSHQDPLTQERIMDSVQDFGASTVVIAHRPEAVKHASRILHLEDGRVVLR